MADFKFKPLVKPENSIVISLTIAGFVAGSYFGLVGPASDVHATDALDGNVGASLKKAGWAAAALVGAATLLSRDLNPVILGGGAIIVMELYYRHAHMTNPATGQIDAGPQDYAPTGTYTQLSVVGAETGYTGPIEAVVG